jgi:mRNA interferase MazF
VKRGDLVTVALQGSHGKPRPALIVQTDRTGPSSHVAVLLLTSEDRDIPLARVPIEADSETGLEHRSFAMLDRITTAPREKIGRLIGQAGDATMLEISRALAVFLGFA